MKISIRQDKLKKALGVIEKIASSSTSLPILGNVLLEAEDSLLRLSATNLETGVDVWERAKVEKQGKTTIPARVFSSFINYLPSDSVVRLEVKGTNVHLECGSTKTKINSMDAEEFPVLPEVEKDGHVAMPGMVFAGGLAQVAGVASTSSIKPELSGVYLDFKKDTLVAAATDSFRLAEKKIGLQKPLDPARAPSLIIPQRAASFLKTVLGEEEQNCLFHFSPNLIMVEISDEEEQKPRLRFVSKLVEGDYPDYKEIIPSKLRVKAVVDKDEFLNQLRRASLFASRINEVRLTFFPDKDEIEVFCQNQDLGEYSSLFPAEIEGEKREVSFNYKFLIDGLGNIKEDSVIVGLSSSSREEEEDEEGPAVLKPAQNETYLYVVMPIQPA